MAAIGTAANASLISNKSTLLLLQPVLAYSFFTAPIGAVVNSLGACACVAWPWILAITVQPSFLAVDSRMSTRAAAPSLIDDDEAAVMVPSFLNAGRSVGIFSTLAFIGPSSLSMMVSPLRPDTVTGAISHLKWPSAVAATARRTDSIANASCASRVK